MINSRVPLKEMRWALALLWLVSALLPLLPSVQNVALDELSRFGFAKMLVVPFMVFAILIDLFCGYLALRVVRAWAWMFQMGVVIAYTALLTYSHPTLWLDPFGALLKNLPIVTAMFVLMQADTVHVKKR